MWRKSCGCSTVKPRQWSNERLRTSRVFTRSLTRSWWMLPTTSSEILPWALSRLTLIREYCLIMSTTHPWRSRVDTPTWPIWGAIPESCGLTRTCNRLWLMSISGSDTDLTLISFSLTQRSYTTLYSTREPTPLSWLRRQLLRPRLLGLPLNLCSVSYLSSLKYS